MSTTIQVHPVGTLLARKRSAEYLIKRTEAEIAALPPTAKEA